ncbi:MAG: tetratricopeptide repeat protein [Pyrinomonadaceae bacterium]
MANVIYTINAKSAAGRFVILGAIAAALVFAWFGVRWQVANMLGELTPPSQEDALRVAEAAVSLSPRDPLPRWLLASALREDFSRENLEASLHGFEATVRRSPNDYRWWIELGRAYEQAERPEDAEKAFRRAIDLAPTYTFPQWQMGNFLLRQNRADEAFEFLTRTTEKSIVYREQVFALAWDYFDKDPARVEQLAADTPSVRVTLARFYAERGAASDALRVWNSIAEEERSRHPEILKAMTQELYTKRHFRETLELARQSGIDPDAQVEAISNAGFENFLGDPESTMFGWRINRSDSKLEILADSSFSIDGKRSLKLNFKSYARPELNNVTQLAAVQPRGRYRLTFMLRTENLRTGGLPLIEIVDAKHDVPIARGQPFPLGSSDWQEMSIEFVVPEDSDGVTIRTVRQNCGELCPISGVIWYDAFKLQRLPDVPQPAG